MASTAKTALAVAVEPFRVFAVEVRGVQRLSPSFVRVTFTGPDLAEFADNGFDQRIKMVFPTAGAAAVTALCDAQARGDDWYEAWRSTPNDQRPALRTYTVGAVRQHDAEVDIDMVLHGDGGPASRWAVAAAPGDKLALVGPNAAYIDVHGGVEFRPAMNASTFLLAGDETALPAIAGIARGMPRDAVGEIVIEVPDERDNLEIAAPAGVLLTWLPRGERPRGERLVAAVHRAMDRLTEQQLAASTATTATSSPALEEPDEFEILWDVPDEATPAHPSHFYAWLAGEAGVIKTLRRYLVRECGVDRRAVAFMGYWKQGHAES